MLTSCISGSGRLSGICSIRNMGGWHSSAPTLGASPSTHLLLHANVQMCPYKGLHLPHKQISPHDQVQLGFEYTAGSKTW